MNPMKVVVIGGGFAGLRFCRSLSPAHFEVTLIDQINHHQFQPLFYQVASSQIEPSSISFPLRSVFGKKSGIRVLLAEVYSIRHEAKSLDTSAGEFNYDLLILATGCRTNYFGNANIQAHALSLKTTAEAIAIRNHVLRNFEQISVSSEEDRAALMNLVIVGGGPTGVELAGAFAEIRDHILPRDYPGLDFSSFRIILVEGSPHTLNSMSESARHASADYLRGMGVEIRTRTYVQDYDGQTVRFQDGETLASKTVIWAAGVTGNFLNGLPESVRAPGNRIRVNRFSEVPGMEDVYALGDVAFMETPLYPKGHPQLANVAINQAVNLAQNLELRRKGKPLHPFEYKDLGSMATIGKHKAVVDLPFWKFKGYFAWLVWMFLHLMLILSVRNKLLIFINWAWNYFSSNTSLRLILEPDSKRRK